MVKDGEINYYYSLIDDVNANNFYIELSLIRGISYLYAKVFDLDLPEENWPKPSSI